MDDIIIRPRYPRHSIPVRRRKKFQKEEIALKEKIKRQLLISGLLLISVVVIKSIDTPFTNFVSDRIKDVILKNIEIKNVYESIEGLINKFIKGSEANSSENKAVLDMSKNSQTADSMEARIGLLKEKHVFIQPVEGILASSFGDRVDPITNQLKKHNGIDIEAKKGSPVKAFFDGTVIDVGSERTYGNYLKIQHADGIVTVYAHCSEIIAQKRQVVKQGDIIAKVGDTGTSTGSHLHFEIWLDGKAIDPLNFISIVSE